MKVAQLRNYDIANGDGIRVSIFISGCKFNCKNCFNKEYQDFNYGEKYNQDNVIKLLQNDNVCGLSVLGGDPLWQNEADLEKIGVLFDEVHKLKKDVWIWTGFKYEDLSESQFNLIKKADVLIDGQFIEELKDLRLKYRGSSNQRVINVKETLKNNKIIIKN